MQARRMFNRSQKKPCENLVIHLSAVSSRKYPPGLRTISTERGHVNRDLYHVRARFDLPLARRRIEDSRELPDKIHNLATFDA